MEEEERNKSKMHPSAQANVAGGDAVHPLPEAIPAAKTPQKPAPALKKVGKRAAAAAGANDSDEGEPSAKVAKGN